MASSTIRPSSASSLFRLCNPTITCAASLVSLNPSSRRFPYLASGNHSLLFFPSVSYYSLNLLYIYIFVIDNSSLHFWRFSSSNLIES
jgi:hypothetical protein